MELYDRIIEVLNNFDEATLVNVWNDYAERNNYFEDMVHYMSEFEEVLQSKSVDLSFLRGLFDNDFDPNADYYKENYSDYESFDDLGEVVDLDTLAEYIESNQETFGEYELEELFEEEDEEEEN